MPTNPKLLLYCHKLHQITTSSLLSGTILKSRLNFYKCPLLNFLLPHCYKSTKLRSDFLIFLEKYRAKTSKSLALKSVWARTKIEMEAHVSFVSKVKCYKLTHIHYPPTFHKAAPSPSWDCWPDLTERFKNIGFLLKYHVVNLSKE